MKAVLATCCAVAVSVSSMMLAGCAGASSASNSAPPPPVMSPSHGTFVYVGVGDQPGSGASTSGFRLNADGTLTAVPGSPFSIVGHLAVSGSVLVAADNGSVTSFLIDPSSGSLTRAGSAMVNGSFNAIAADATNVYVGGQASDGSNIIYSFSVAAEGSLTANSGSPFFFNNDCPCEIAAAMAIQNGILFVSGIGLKNNGFVAVYRSQAGVLANMQSISTIEIDRLTLHPSGRLAYGVDFSPGDIQGFTIDVTGKPGQSFLTGDDSLGAFKDVAIDPSGKFLLAIDETQNDSRITVFSVNLTTGALTEMGAPVPTGAIGGNGIKFDASGRFVIVSHGNTVFAANDVMVFAFDQMSGSLTKMQSAPTGQNPDNIAIATF